MKLSDCLLVLARRQIMDDDDIMLKLICQLAKELVRRGKVYDYD